MTFYKILIITLALPVALATAVSISPLGHRRSPAKIEPRGLVILDGKFIDEHEPKLQINCPIEECVTKNPSYRNHLTKSRWEDHLQVIKKKLKYSWLKDGQPFFGRENGNRIDEFYNGSFIVLYQIGSSDQGRYRCQIDYSEVPPDPDLLEQFNFCEAMEFEVQLQQYLPDIAPIITNPPLDAVVSPGNSVTWSCNWTEALSTPTIHWFKSCSFKHPSCMKEFEVAFNETLKSQDSRHLQPFFIPGSSNQNSFTVDNVTEGKTGYYGCVTENLKGIDIRRARLQLVEQALKDLDIRALESRHRDSRNSVDWIWLAIGMAAFCVPAILIAGCVCFFKHSVLRQKKQNAPLIQSVAGKDPDSNEWNSRRRLPNIEAADIYNTGKSHHGFITGHLHQPSGHMMTQSVCSKLLDKTTPSISSANSQQSDEASHLWGKSPYTASSSTTATNVQMYDHPPSTGTFFFHGACINNPTYGLVRPDNEVYMLARQLERQLVISENDYTELTPEHAYYNVNAVEV